VHCCWHLVVQRSGAHKFSQSTRGCAAHKHPGQCFGSQRPGFEVAKSDMMVRREMTRKNSEFISLHSIIRGTVLLADSDRAGDFLAFDVLDGDTSL
jgi:hypothetical protein